MTYTALEAALARITDLEVVASDLRKEILQYGRDTARLERQLRDSHAATAKAQAELDVSRRIHRALHEELTDHMKASLGQHLRQWWRMRGW